MPKCERRFAELVLLSLLLAAGCAAGQEASGAASAPADAEERGPSCAAPVSLADARLLVGKYCVSCHSPSGVAGPDYDFRSDSAITAHRRNIEAKLRLRAMPPPSAAQPSDADRGALLCWAKG